MFLNVLEFDTFFQVPLNVLESTGVYLNVLEDLISTLLFHPSSGHGYQLPMIFIIFCTCDELFPIN